MIEAKIYSIFIIKVWAHVCSHLSCAFLNNSSKTVLMAYNIVRHIHVRQAQYKPLGLCGTGKWKVTEAANRRPY